MWAPDEGNDGEDPTDVLLQLVEARSHSGRLRRRLLGALGEAWSATSTAQEGPQSLGWGLGGGDTAMDGAGASSESDADYPEESEDWAAAQSTVDGSSEDSGGWGVFSSSVDSGTGASSTFSGSSSSRRQTITSSPGLDSAPGERAVFFPPWFVGSWWHREQSRRDWDHRTSPAPQVRA